MSEKGARALLAICSLVLAACGAKTLDFTATGDDAAPGPFVTTTFRGSPPNKVDLLFMIDNSSSMAEKQTILATAVADLIDQLIEPRCVDPLTGRAVGNAINGVCTVGEIAFEPVKDIHIGIISSSLGNHGASGVCEDVIDIGAGRSDPHNDDRAYLLTRGVGGTAVRTFHDQGFLNYNPGVEDSLASSEALPTLKNLVGGVGQHGCGYEASLEAVYRFLVDPEPYAAIHIDTSIGVNGQALLDGIDQQVLQQRADFLRPDSLVSVVLVTDENDCSTIDGGQGFYALVPPVPGSASSIVKRGTSICKTNPNDKCCFNCGATQPPAACPQPQTDPECVKGELSQGDDRPNLRCFNQKQRYGADFLYPVSRYIDGFSKSKIVSRSGKVVDNPLFVNPACGPGCSVRDPSLVFATGIVGVPWQDLAVDPTDLKKGYKTAGQLRESGTWATIVGDPLNPAGPVPPGDSHMVESIKPRLGLPGPKSGPNADVIHGHEWDPTVDYPQPYSDLQYACIFDLAPTRICTSPEDCDCFETPSEFGLPNKPICQNAQGAYTNEQTRAKAYPGTRILQVLQGLGDQGVAASICPAQTTSPNTDDYGYTPAMRAIVSRLRNPLRGPCMPQVLQIAPDGRTSCSIIEVHGEPTCDCSSEPGRRPAANDLVTPEMRSKGSCFCEILPLSGQALHECKTNLNPQANIGNGWCYVDPAQDGDASCELVVACPRENERMIRFINGNSLPRPRSTPFLHCPAPPLTTTPPAVCK